MGGERQGKARRVKRDFVANNAMEQRSHPAAAEFEMTKRG